MWLPGPTPWPPWHKEGPFAEFAAQETLREQDVIRYHDSSYLQGQASLGCRIQGFCSKCQGNYSTGYLGKETFGILPAKAWRSFAWVPCVPRTSDEVGAQRWFKHTSSHIPVLTIYLLPATAQGPELEDRCQDPEPF